MVLVRQRLAGAALLWLCALALVGLGTVHALRLTDHGGTEGVYDALHGLADDPRVAVRSLDPAAPNDDLRIAALRLALRWEERGYTVTLPGLTHAPSRPGPESSAPARYEVLLGALGSSAGADPEDPSQAWSSLGLSIKGDAWATSDGKEWPRDSSVVGVTLTQRQLQEAASRLGSLGLQAPVASSAELVTLLVHPSSGAAGRTPWLGYALKALSLESPPCGPRVVLWSGGGRVFEVDLDEDGYATKRTRSYPAAPAATSLVELSATSDSAELVASALRASAAIRSLGQSSAPAVPLGVAELADLGPYTRDGALQRCGWYDVTLQRLVVVPGLKASADDATEDFLEAELLRSFGRPASPWFLRGMIYGFTGRAGGFLLKDLESISQPVAFEEVLTPTRGRTRLALAPAEARLMRSVLAAFNSDISAAFGVRFGEDEDMLQRLRAQWNKGLARAPKMPAKTRTRRWSGGVSVEIASPIRGFGQFGSAELHDDFQRIAALGFNGVQLAVHVPVAPPTHPEGGNKLTPNAAWGYSVTVEGDGAVQWSAAKARAQGLSVVLAPRFVMSATAGHGHRQVHGSPERIRLYGERRAAAMEGAAWLAEQIGAEALIMFDSVDLPNGIPSGIQGDATEARTLVDAAKTNLRERSALFAGPFVGQRIAFCLGVAQLTQALSESMGDTAVGLQLLAASRANPQAALRQIRAATEAAGGALRALRLDSPIRGPKAGDELSWSQLQAPPGAALLGPWRLTARRPPASRRLLPGSAAMLAGRNLREFSDASLRGLAGLLE